MNEESKVKEDVVENATKNKGVKAINEEKANTLQKLSKTLREIADKVESGEAGEITISLLVTFNKEENTTCVLIGHGENVVRMFAGAAEDNDNIARQMAMGLCYSKPEIVKGVLIGSMLFHSKNGR